MNTRLLARSILAVVTVLGLGRGILAGSDTDAETEDILYMADGRELHGHILDETATAVTFELIDRRVDIRAKITFSKDDIAQIHRDVPLEAPAPEPKRAFGPFPGAASRLRGAARDRPRQRQRLVLELDRSLELRVVYRVEHPFEAGSGCHTQRHEVVARDQRLWRKL